MVKIICIREDAVITRKLVICLATTPMSDVHKFTLLNLAEYYFLFLNYNKKILLNIPIM